MMTKSVKNVSHHNLAIFKPKLIGESSSELNEKFKSKNISDYNNYSGTLGKKFEELVGEEHPFDYRLIEETVKKVGIVNSILEKYTDFTIGQGIYIESADNDLKEELEKFITKTNINLFLKPWLKEALAKGAGYMEVADFSKNDKQPSIKVINSNTVYVKRDDTGVIKEYNQFIGDSRSIVKKENVNNLNINDIVHLNINKVGSCAYGHGIVYSCLSVIDDLILAQKSMHKLVKRKANNPIHVAIGNEEKDDYPKQADIDAYGQKLTYMNESTEWVTGPNVRMNVIDFGNIGDKFMTVLDNDYKLLSYSFQVPELLLGSDRGFTGSSNVQMDAFLRNCKSKQEDMIFVLKSKIFDILATRIGKSDVEYKICFDDESDEEANKRIEVIKNLLSINLSPQMKISLEKKLSYLLDIDYDEKLAEQQQKDAQAIQLGQIPEEKEEKEPTEYEEESINTNAYNISDHLIKLSENLKGRYKDIKHYLLHTKEDLNSDFTIKEWTRKDYTEYKESIINAIKQDKFSDLLANTKTEQKAGYLDDVKVNKLRNVFIDAFENDKSLASITQDIKDEVKIGNLYEYNKRSLVKDKNGHKIMLLDKDSRAEMIAKTESVRLSNIGAMKEMNERGVELAKWNTVLDEKTCPICESLDGAIFEVSSFNDAPPAHPSCRCYASEISTRLEKLDNVKKILDEGIKKGLSPQELEISLMQLLKISQNRLSKFVKSYIDLKEKSNGKN